MAAWSLYKPSLLLGDEYRQGKLVREIRRYKSKAAAVHAASKHSRSDGIFADKTFYPPKGRRPR